MMSESEKCVFREGTLLLLDDTHLQLSFGVWNYRALSIEFRAEQRDMMRSFVTGALSDGISIRELQERHDLAEGDLAELRDLFERLHTDGLLFLRRTIDQSIFGSLLLLGLGDAEGRIFGGEKPPETRPNLAILTDVPNLREACIPRAYDRWLNISTFEFSSLPRLLHYDSAAGTDTTATLAFLDEYKFISQYPVILVLLSWANPRALRNLNRILLHYRLPWVLCTLDGPFVMLTSFIPEQTGCFECMELRIMAQMRSMNEYKSFVSALAVGDGPLVKRTEFAPSLQPAASLAINEALLMASMRIGQFVGRLLSIYTPLFEIQVQDVLRIPICPACGGTSRATMKELYFDFRRFVTDFTEKIRTE